MRCPNCGARMKKGDNMCARCGTKLSQIENASHQAVVKVRAEFQPEKVVLSTVWPKDLSYRNTLLFCIFLGLFGGHYFYTKRYVPAIIYCSVWSIFLLTIIIGSAIAGGGFPYFESNNINHIVAFVCCGGALISVLWLTDIIKIIFKRFNVPVVLEENKKQSNLKGK